MPIIKEFEHLRIGLEAIKSATNHFSDSHCIGRGGFGKVYKGELLHLQGQTMVAVKRLDPAFGQGPPEFWKEILLLTRYRHENVVSLLGFCDENGENILVYEYLSNKSLDLYLNSTRLSWKQRLNICVGAARGLEYLHNPGTTEHRVLHRDIKSSNILLDDNWQARISDFGLSKIGPANQPFTFLFSNAVGTMGYCDPLYMETGFLTKESDIYSFGVVLFEILCGRSCVGNYDDIRRFLPILAKQCYEEKKLETIIHNTLREQISPNCLHKFSTIAYRCLQRDRKKRPLVDEIVKEIEVALEYQIEYEFDKEKKTKSHVVLEFNSDEYWEMKLPRDWEIIVRMFNIPRDVYTDKKKLFSLLQNGILFDKRHKVFSINDDGKKCEMISATRFLDADSTSYEWIFQRNLRFARVAKFPYKEQLNIQWQVRASMLSLGIMYAATLVFKIHRLYENNFDDSKCVRIKWKCEELSTVSSTHFAERVQDRWLKVRMWHFINYEKNADFDIVLDSISYFEDECNDDILIQGLEFRPVELMEQQEETEVQESVSISDEDVDWEKNMPHDYKDIIQRSDKLLEYTSNKELYFLLCAGILIDNGRMWFSLCKSTGGKCHMVPAEDIFLSNFGYKKIYVLSESRSRFKKVIQLQKNTYTCKYKLRSHMFSPENVYACYVVFKYAADCNINGTNDGRLLRTYYYLDEEYGGYIISHLNMREPMNIPIIKPKNSIISHDSSNIPSTEVIKMPEGCPGNWVKQRNDGWMEAILCESLHKLEQCKSLDMKVYIDSEHFDKVIVEGVEFRPMQGYI